MGPNPSLDTLAAVAAEEAMKASEPRGKRVASVAAEEAMKVSEPQGKRVASVAAEGAMKASEPRGKRVVRVIVRDDDATDSSSSEDEAPRPLRRARRGSKTFMFERRLKRSVKKASGTGPANRFRGVRQRPWGRWAAEIRDPHNRRRLWLGTFNTAEEAAAAYDSASIRLRGARATTNFPSTQNLPPPEPAEPVTSHTPAPGELTMPSVPVNPSSPLQVKKAVGSSDGEVEVGDTSEVQAVVDQPMPSAAEIIVGKRSGCGSGSRVRAIHAASVCVDEVGGD